MPKKFFTVSIILGILVIPPTKTTSLISARELIKESDFFVGTDSFLIHLAYFYNKSFFIVFNYEYFDFLPPGCEVIGNYVIINPLEDNKNKIKRRLSLLGVL